MTFDSREFADTQDVPIYEDRYHSVELATLFKQLTCYRCDFTDIYHYAVKQLRRKSREEVLKGGQLGPEQEEVWLAIPRYAEIPQTIHCKSCGEVLGLYTECIY